MILLSVRWRLVRSKILAKKRYLLMLEISKDSERLNGKIRPQGFTKISKRADSSRETMRKAIILSGHCTGLALIRGLGAAGVPVSIVYYDRNEMGHLSKYVEERYLIKDPEEHEDEFIDFFCSGLKGHEGSVILPADDTTLAVTSRYKGLLEDHGYIVGCSDWNVVHKVLEKIHTYRVAEKIGVPVPKTDLIQDVDKIDGILENTPFPCLVKPCVSHQYHKQFGYKLKKVFSVDEAVRAIRKALDQNLDVMVQEYIPSEENNGVNYNSYMWDGQILLEHTAEKLRMTKGGFGVPNVVVNRNIEAIKELAPPLLRKIGLTGYSCTEFKKDPRDNLYKLMEINGRYNRSGLQPISAGINFPWFMYCHLTGKTLPVFTPVRETVYWIDEFNDLASEAARLFSRKIGIREFFRPYLRKHVYAVYDKNDLLPFFKRAYSSFAQAVKKPFTMGRLS